MILLFALAIFTLASDAAAQDVPVSSSLPPEARQFDLWIGEWDVNLRVRQDDLTWEDQIQAVAKVYPILNGKAVLELWSDDRPSGIEGYSIRSFDPERNDWLLCAETISRYTFSDITPRSLRWDDTYSSDGGRTWTPDWIMEFTRTASKPSLPSEGGPADTFPFAGPEGDPERAFAFSHVTWNTSAERYELTTLTSNAGSPVRVFYSRGEELVFHERVEGDRAPDRFRIEENADGSVTWEHATPDGDGWRPVWRATVTAG